MRSFFQIKERKDKYALPTHPHNESFFSCFLQEVVKFLNCRLFIGLRGPQRRGSVMGSKEYKVGLKTQPKVVLLSPKAMPKYLLNISQNTLKKSRKSIFSTPKMVKNDPWNHPKWANFWPIISIFGTIYQPLELKIQPKLGLFKSKTMPKHFLNNSKTNSKKFRKRLFRPQKWPNHGC